MDVSDLLRTSHQNIVRLSDAGALRRAAHQIGQIANSQGASSLLAASAVAERLIGATLMLQDASDRGSRPAPSDRTVLIVDVNFASGTALARAAQRARRSGARQVIAVVMHQLTAASVDTRRYDVDRLIFLSAQEPAPGSSL